MNQRIPRTYRFLTRKEFRETFEFIVSRTLQCDLSQAYHQTPLSALDSAQKLQECFDTLELHFDAYLEEEQRSAIKTLGQLEDWTRASWRELEHELQLPDEGDIDERVRYWAVEVFGCRSEQLKAHTVLRALNSSDKVDMFFDELYMEFFHGSLEREDRIKIISYQQAKEWATEVTIEKTSEKRILMEQRKARLHKKLSTPPPTLPQNKPTKAKKHLFTRKKADKPRSKGASTLREALLSIFVLLVMLLALLTAGFTWI